MKTFTNVEIEQIRKDLSNGIAYCGVKDTYCIGYISSPNNGYIYYQRWGQCAVADTNENLIRILNNTFGDCETIIKAFAGRYEKARIFM